VRPKEWRRGRDPEPPDLELRHLTVSGEGKNKDIVYVSELGTLKVNYQASKKERSLELLGYLGTS